MEPDSSATGPAGPKPNVQTARRDPLVSVVISTFRSERFMHACLDNLSRQTIFDQCEVIVVDSASPENERAIVAKFQQEFSNIRYLRTPHDSTSEAFNRGLGLSRGRYWAFLCTDDSLRDDALELCAAALDRHPDCALAYADTAWTTRPNDRFPSNNIVKTVKYSRYRPVDALFFTVTGCMQFWRTASLRELGGYDGTFPYANDYHAIIKMMTRRMNAVYVPEALSLFYQNTGGLTQSSNRSAGEHGQVMEAARAN